MAESSVKKVAKLVNEELTDAKDIPASENPSEVHVDLFLKAKGIKLWERGGMRAYAKSKGKEFATDSEFEELFKKY